MRAVFRESLSPCLTPSTPVFHRCWFAMNTRFSFVLVGIRAEKSEALALAAEREMHEHERMMSRFDAQSPVSDLNRRAADEAVTPPEMLWEILAICRNYHQKTCGAFDITLWPLNQLWRERVQRGQEPTEEALMHAQQLTGMHNVLFDDAAHTIRFACKGMSIDLGGFGKGFALESLARNLHAQRVERVFLSHGESSITVLGYHPHGTAWPVGITSIFDPSQVIYTFQIKDASLSSSGTAPFNRLDGKKVFGQIIYPLTGRPVEGYRTMSVVSPSTTEAEVLSTVLLVTREQDRAALLSRFSATAALEIVYHSHQTEFVPHVQWHYRI
jgi:FAD:protein FMN transferase